MCDTFIALPNTTEDTSVIFAKNSDREANEAQILEYHAGNLYDVNTKVKCTYMTIPQVKKTNGILISRPFWMWGAEMGVNEHGVAIGNEAVFTKLKVEKIGVLTGMDLLRLALERSDSARKAKEMIIDLLQKYGQGGMCGYEDSGMYYHNSFIIADKKESWVLETAGKFWACKKVKDYYAISNGLTIGSNFDSIHPEAEAYARKKGWVKGEFHFANAFSDFLFTTFSACKTRRSRADELLVNKVSVKSAIAHLRDHNTTNFNPSKPLLGNTICAHAGNSITRNASQTTGSMIVHLKNGNITIWITATAAPCISAFKPIWFDKEVVPDLGGVLSGTYNKNIFWWKHERLHRKVLENYKLGLEIIEEERNVFENDLLHLVYTNKRSGFEISQKAFKNHKFLIDEWITGAEQRVVKDNSNFIYKKYWKKLNRKAGVQKTKVAF